MLEGPWHAVLYTADILETNTFDCNGRELALMAQLISSDQEFPCEFPKDLSQLPAELTQHLLLIPVRAVPVQDESISFLLLSSIQA